ncbi:hypothetical protein LDENG_00102570, partial [Lucifuga dentata]
SARRSPEPPCSQPSAAPTAPAGGSSSSSSSSGPPHGQPAPTTADVLGPSPHAPFHDPRTQPTVSPGVVPVCPADRLHPPAADAAWLQPQPHGSRAAGPYAVWYCAISPPGAHPSHNDADGHPGSSGGATAPHATNCPQRHPSFLHHTFLLPGTPTSAASSSATAVDGRHR